MRTTPSSAFSMSMRRGRSLTISTSECASSNWRCTRTKPGGYRSRCEAELEGKAAAGESGRGAMAKLTDEQCRGRCLLARSPRVKVIGNLLTLQLERFIRSHKRPNASSPVSPSPTSGPSGVGADACQLPASSPAAEVRAVRPRMAARSRRALPRRKARLLRRASRTTQGYVRRLRDLEKGELAQSRKSTWRAEPAAEFVLCDCGWRADLGKHYRVQRPPARRW
jgi:hypothetical protein